MHAPWGRELFRKIYSQKTRVRDKEYWEMEILLLLLMLCLYNISILNIIKPRGENTNTATIHMHTVSDGYACDIAYWQNPMKETQRLTESHQSYGNDTEAHTRVQQQCVPRQLHEDLQNLPSLQVGVRGHGRLMDPPARNAMWRLGYPNPVNYNDNELYCGGFVGEMNESLRGFSYLLLF